MTRKARSMCRAHSCNLRESVVCVRGRVVVLCVRVVIIFHEDVEEDGEGQVEVEREVSEGR